MMLSASAMALNVGQGIYDITGPSIGINFMGMANPSQKGTGIHFRLRARAFAFSEGASRVGFVSLDAGMAGFVLKKRVLAQLEAALGPSVYTDENLCISGTHTHSGPSGFLEHTIFQFAGSGWVPSTIDAMVNGTANAILRAHRALAPADVRLGVGTVPNASISRSPTAYLFNPAAERALYPEGDTDNTMVQLTVRTAGTTSAVLNWHATHGTSMNNTNTLVSGDNKGWASYLLEKKLNGPTSSTSRVGDGPFVAAFGATALGDVSPNTRGARCRDTGLPCDAIHSTCNGRVKMCSSSGEGADMFESTRLNAERQLKVASELMAAADSQPALAGPVRSVHSFVKMAGLEVAARQGQTQHALCKAAMGVSFAAGTTDGPGMFNFEQGAGNSSNPFWRFIGDILHVATTEEIACQHPKAILLSTGSISIPYPWATDTAPLQLLQIGQLVIIAVPTEMTTMAGRRTRAAVKARLVDKGVLDDSGVVVIAGLSNDYQDYTTTYEEFQQQRYEGGSTIYGPLQLDGYIQELLRLADHLANGTTPASDPAPTDFTNRVIATGGDKSLEEAPKGSAFGDVSADVAATVAVGERASVTFVGGSLNNDLRTQDTMVRVERQAAKDGAWTLVAEDSDLETRLSATKEGGLLSKKHYDVTVTWDVPKDAAAGLYRIVHLGASWQKSGLFAKAAAVPYTGVSSTFTVTRG